MIKQHVAKQEVHVIGAAEINGLVLVLPTRIIEMVARCVKLLSRQISLIMKMWGVLIHILICDMSLNKLRRKTRRSSFFIIPPETRKVGFRST